MDGRGPHPPAPSPTFGEGVEGLGRGPRMGLDCGLRRNDGGVGAINRAPTAWLYVIAASQMGLVQARSPSVWKRRA